MDYTEDENVMPVDNTSVQQQAQNKKKDVDEASSVASQFCHLYYEILEKKQRLAGQIYLENSVMLWDGNPVSTREKIQKFIAQLPSLTFNLSTMDCQSINSAAVGSKKSFIITVAGQYRVSGVGTVKRFTQQIVITADQDKWKIATDTFRTQ